MRIKKSEYNNWAVYFLTIFITVYIHEIGHCIPAWIHGFRAIPTPSNEYIVGTIPVELKQYVSLGGISSTILVSLAILFLFIVKNYKYNSAILAGAIVMPGIYTLRFALAGRGHDATEFQEAQSAMGLNYSGHSVDWIFLIIFSLGVIVWLLKSRPHHKFIGRLSIGFILTLIFIVGLQVINNAVFDPIFNSK